MLAMVHAQLVMFAVQIGLHTSGKTFMLKDYSYSSPFILKTVLFIKTVFHAFWFSYMHAKQ